MKTLAMAMGFVATLAVGAAAAPALEGTPAYSPGRARGGSACSPRKPCCRTIDPRGQRGFTSFLCISGIATRPAVL